jgi:Family of unknown function (DUF6502)
MLDTAQNQAQCAYCTFLLNFFRVSQPNPQQTEVLQALEAILEPLAGLLLSNEIRYGQAEELLKMAFVRASARAFAAQEKLPSVTTVSVATGIRRREVKRLVDQPWTGAAPKIAPAIQARLRWATDPRFLDKKGQPRALARSPADGAVTFADLAAATSKDVHPKALLDELLRIGAVQEREGAVILKYPFQAQNRRRDEVLRAGSMNVADHLSALLLNVLSDQPPLLERAIFADGLTQASAQQGTELAREYWADALAGLREKMQHLVDTDAQVPENTWRMRIGIYSYLAPMDRSVAPVQARPKKPAAKKTPARRKPARSE